MLVRLAEPSDAMAVARVHVRSWQAAYRDLLPQDYLDQLRPEDRAQRYDFTTRDPQKPQTMVGVEGDSLIGFATTSPSRDAELAGWGELCALYVDPEFWGRGMGKALILAARRRLVDSGFTNAILWLLEGNQRADRFYRIDEWVPDGTRRAESIWGITVNELRYRTQLNSSRT